MAENANSTRAPGANPPKLANAFIAQLLAPLPAGETAAEVDAAAAKNLANMQSDLDAALEHRDLVRRRLRTMPVNTDMECLAVEMARIAVASLSRSITELRVKMRRAA